MNKPRKLSQATRNTSLALSQHTPIPINIKHRSSASISVHIPTFNYANPTMLPSLRPSYAKFQQYNEALKKVTYENQGSFKNAKLIKLLMKSKLIEKLKREEINSIKRKRQRANLAQMKTQIQDILRKHKISINLTKNISHTQNSVVYLPNKSLLTERTFELNLSNVHDAYEPARSKITRKGELQKIIKQLNPIKRLHDYMSNIRKSINLV